MDTFTDGRTVTRAKVYVAEVTHLSSGAIGSTYHKIVDKVVMRFVSGNDPDSENARFWDATPTAEPITMIIQNPAACGIFQPGQEYYLDFVLAVRTPSPDA